MLPIHQMDYVWEEDRDFLSTPLYSILMGLGGGTLGADVPTSAKDQGRASSCLLTPMPHLCDPLAASLL